ncbi:hypothetical protein DSM43518_03250 [Mycobacterium marinum]|uniref:hypothetical protein n=1 Tax=Mycobacterium marinum TaxID=1781 RepID=UPI00035889FD|nr:hypothetical protein [Mycobacterium marinum]AXN46664.1 hypothetical protein MM1218R_04752 [Mycobacterium marinum]AXN52091.1 hypothetical protein CCUG20998_04708 [Mycobacterium marinum]EPQ73903.1 hypothetical protein MMEU_1563 [Mycobacterium marinum str. Europe]RFZ07603.1 hypothetical protein DSM43518_03250 [Mycobacterium marinum]RFZ07860.1 hypothetical protein DE4381_02610 [Mycobacterium marinum]
MRYRLDVVASTVIDVVRYAGGWLFDRAMAGWDVTVLVADHLDDRPLHILGAQTLDLECALASAATRPRPQALAAGADLFGCDPRVRRGVLQAIDHGVTEVTLWGESWPAELEASVSRVLHPLSAAARTFKAAALAAAAAAPGAVDGSEIFRSGLVARDSVAADLVPA